MMATCYFCDREMTTADSCTANALNHGGRQVPLWPYGKGPYDRQGGPRCGDCGVQRGGYHHPGCDLQRCPICRGQLMSCDCMYEDDYDDDDDDEDDDWLRAPAVVEPLGVDGNGLLTERMMMGDQEVIIHRDDVPDSDITVHKGIRVTTPLRTVIDCAPDMTQLDLLECVQDCLERGLFTVADAWQRLAQPDMVGRRGAEMLRHVLPPNAA